MSFKRYSIYLYGLSFIPFFIGCGDKPAEPLPPAWQSVTTVPFGANAISVRNRDPYEGVYIVVNQYISADRERSYILWYDGYTFHEVFNKEHDGSYWLNDIGFEGDSGWAIGGMRNPENGGLPFEPVMVEFDVTDGTWHETTIEKDGLGSLNVLYPINERECWIAADEEHEWAIGDRLLKYANDEWTLSEPVNVGVAAYSKETASFYVAGFSGDEEREILITTTWPVKWFKEKAVFDAFGYKLEKITSIYPIGGNLFLTVKFEGEFTGVVRRSGEPGAGLYELVYLSNKSGDVFRVGHLAFINSVNGLAVGDRSSVFFDGVKWHIEELPYGIVFKDIAAYPPEGGYWAYGENLGIFSRYDLLYHP